ncbi:phospholipase A [Roseateles albus]|uniref:Phospholipase A1 n=1 Tax=Roseateles albus TaxID=2987525 RepID=A0ABT5KGG2_9BURK|nr:phospholipase A [Roseateles albus]MDC8773013.1 phospholipase A [Roseateles albus]
MKHDAERLACFDRVHPPSPESVSDAAVSTAPAASHNNPPDAKLGSATLSNTWSTQGIESFSLRPYRAIYVLPISATDNINRRPSSPAPGHDVGVDLPNRAEEVKFQLSAKTLLWSGVFGERGDLWLAYTQSSRWQLYQGDISRPFRETNYEPEMIFNVVTDWNLLGWTGRTAGLALNHQSNGRAQPLSRSWNRLIAHVGLEHGDWSIQLRPWMRLSETADKDDNPDILDHMGRGDLTIRRALPGGNGGGALSLRLRHTLRGGDASRGSAEFEWAFPLVGRLQGYVQAFSGYGESLIDYNIHQNRVGIGFSLAGWH